MVYEPLRELAEYLQNKVQHRVKFEQADPVQVQKWLRGSGAVPYKSYLNII